MSFASSVKNEVCRIDAGDNCCLIAELSSTLRISGIVKYNKSKGIIIKLVTENAAFARRVFSLSKKLYGINPEVYIKRNSKLRKNIAYSVVVNKTGDAKRLLDSLKINCMDKEDGELIDCSAIDFSENVKKITRKICCKKAFLRGAFLAGGSVSDPEKAYHLEIVNRSLNMAQELSLILNYFKLNSKVIKRKGNYIVYLKEGENIADFLNIIGAHNALMKFENVRILKEMRNKVNRVVNCETANLGKTVNASVRQIQNIEYIRDNIGFSSLTQGLREIAEARLEHRDASLKELGEMLNPPLGKSGVNHRLRKLDRIAENERGL